jgi:peptide/nickel transport system permease protein
MSEGNSSQIGQVTSVPPENGQWAGEHRSLAMDVARRLLRNRLAMLGAAAVCLFLIAAIGASWLAPYDPVKMEPTQALEGPTRAHPMGTDEYGRDLLSRIMFGSRTSLSVGIISVGLSFVLGTALGLISGYYLGVVDALISRGMDVLYAFPPILLALVMITILGPGLDRLMVAVGLSFTPTFGRICRAAVLAERQKTYVDAARTVGAGDLKIIRRHILPNVFAPLIVNATLCTAYAILAEAGLSYIGLGAQPPTPSWGMMVNKGRQVIEFSPWISLWSGLAIMWTVFAFSVLGDGLRDALDPQLRGR